ncbi:hypothetical protein HYY75_01995, partial [bacterium]|nr:hypothetical protein [bacterium]
MRLRISKRARVFIILFAIWFGFEPMVVAMVQAAPPKVPASVNSQLDNGVDFESQSMSPGDYLKHLINLRGANKKEMEDKACADWLMTISNAYMLMEPGAEDVPTWYSALKSFKQITETVKGALIQIPSTLGTFTEIFRRTTLAFSFFAKFEHAKGIAFWGNRVFSGWQNATQKAQKVLSEKSVFVFLKHMRTPENPQKTSEYFRWVKGKVGLGQDSAKNFQNAQGLGYTLGIGLSIISFALNAYAFSHSEDFKGGRKFSYNQVKTGASAVFALASLVCMFVPGAQIVAIAGLVWAIF